jgi:hypothetical protein
LRRAARLVSAFVVLCAAFCAAARAQSALHEGELWGAYISSIRFNNTLALWNDFHYVIGAFCVSRHGVSYAPESHIEITGGYAYVRLSTPFSTNLVRDEHRPWGQIIGRWTLSAGVGYQGRLRYDARFRQKLDGDNVLQERVFSQRIRIMHRFRFPLADFSASERLHFDIMDEVLFNIGDNLPPLDQNRFYALLGYSRENITIVGGYCQRAIPQASGALLFKHGFTLWMTHVLRLDERKETPVENE